MSWSQSQPIFSSSRNSSTGGSKVLAALNRRQPLKPPDESQCACNWMQSARALPPPLSRMLMSFLMGPWLEKATSTAVKAGQEMMDHPTAFLLSARFCSRPHQLAARRWKETITFTFSASRGRMRESEQHRKVRPSLLCPSVRRIHPSFCPTASQTPSMRNVHWMIRLLAVETHVSLEEH